MKLYLKRHSFTGKATLGTLYIDGKIFCFVVEDEQRELNDFNNDGDFDDIGEGKIYGETAIPKGTYEVELTMSPKYKKLMPLIKGVTGYSGIRIHSGNTEKDTLGCLIVGMKQTLTGVADSRIAYNKLMDKLEGQKDITIKIS